MSDLSDTDAYRIDTNALMSALWRRRLRIGLVTVLALAVTFAVLLFVPKMYESSTSILVERRDTNFLIGSAQTGGAAAAPDQSAIASQIELVQSRDTLLQAAKQANLRDYAELTKAPESPLAPLFAIFSKHTAPVVPATDGADNILLQNIKKGLTVIQERDSRVISIHFRARSPELAAKVANAIAETYVARRAGQMIEDTADATTWLKTEIEKLRKRVSEADAKVAAYKVDKDLFVGPNNTSLLDQQLSDLSSQISQARARQSTAKSKADVLRAMIKAGQPVAGMPSVAQSAVVQSLTAQKTKLQSDRAQKLSTLLPSHPEIRAIDSQIAEINRQIRDEARRILGTLDAEARIESDLVKSLNAQLAGLKVDASGAARDTVTLNEIEREAKAQRDLLQDYLLRYRDASARTDANSALPDVRVVSYAAPATTPASPKSTLILFAVFLVVLVGQVGYILFGELVSGRVLVETDPVRPAESARPLTPATGETIPDVAAPAFAEKSWPQPRAEQAEAPYAPVEPALADLETVMREGTGVDAPADLDPSLDEVVAPAPGNIWTVSSTEPEEPWAEDTDLTVHTDRSEPGPAAADLGLADEAAPVLVEPEPLVAGMVPPLGEAATFAEGDVDWAEDDDEPLNEPYVVPKTELYEDAAPYPGPYDGPDLSEISEHSVNAETPLSSELETASEEPDTPAQSERDVAEAEMVEPVVEPAPVGEETKASKAEESAAEQVEPAAPSPAFEDQIASLVTDIEDGHERLVYIASAAGANAARALADRFIHLIREKHRSVAIIDAGAEKPSRDLGLTDLCDGTADFGDIIHPTGDGDVALIPWGQGTRLDPRAEAPLTLVGALSDIFDLVVVMTGRPGLTSSLPLFAELDGHLLFCGEDEMALRIIATDIRRLGLTRATYVVEDGMNARVA